MSWVWEGCNTGCPPNHQLFLRVIKIVFLLKIALIEIRCLNLIIVIGHGPRYEARSWFLANIILYNPAPAPDSRISSFHLINEHTEELRMNSRLCPTSAAFSLRSPGLGAARPSCTCVWMQAPSSLKLYSHSVGQGRNLCSSSQDESGTQLGLGTVTDTEAGGGCF